MTQTTPYPAIETQVIRVRFDAIEVWDNNISDHFLIRYNQHQPERLDVIYITPNTQQGEYVVG